jgi:acetyl esterase/lipase
VPIQKFVALLLWCIPLLAGAASDDAAGLQIAPRPVLDDHYPPRSTAFEGGVTSLADVNYAVVPGFRPLTLDLYLPPAPNAQRGGFPVLVFVHGGGWSAGHSRQSAAFGDWPAVLASMASRGYVVASLNYRLSGEASAPAAIHDVKNAVRWLRDHAARYRIDAERIGVFGGSAGGQLAALLGTSCGVASLAAPRYADQNGMASPTGPAASDCVQSVVTWYGIFDFSSMLPANQKTAAHIYLGCEPGNCSQAQIEAQSAITHVDRSDPPFLLIHGEADRTVPVAQSRDFAAALRRAGGRVELLVIPGVDHSFIGADAASTASANTLALRKTIEFFDATLRASSR